MAPTGQRIFALVPTTLVSTTGSRPAMTSKAAKKAYAKANQGPKLSRAEKRRLESEELERQKKEFEKEKAARKAKAAREKKQEKEEQARQERRRNREPEKSKWVRASQPTIARFVRSDSGKRKWKDVDEESEGTLLGDEEGDERPAKRLAVAAENKDKDKYMSVDVTTNTQVLEAQGLQAQCEVQQQNGDSEDDFGDFPLLSQPELLENIDPSLSAASSGQQVSGGEAAQSSASQKISESISEHQSQQLPRRISHCEEYDLHDSTQDLEDLVSAQLRSEDAEATARSDAIESPLSAAQPIINCTSHEELPGGIQELCHFNTTSKPDILVSPVCRDRAVKHGSKPTDPTFFASAPPQSPVFVKPFSKMLPNLPPPSTQAFLEANMDEFMPSPSQQVRELLDDIDMEDLPTNTQVAREISPHRPQTAAVLKPNSVDESFDDFFCTQDLILSSQDMREISPARVKPVLVTEQRQTTKSDQPVFKKPFLPKSKLLGTTPDIVATKPTYFEKPPVSNKQVSSYDDLLDDFPSTQDLVLTPEDLKEIGTPLRMSVASKSRNNFASEMLRLLDQNNQPPPGVSKRQAEVLDAVPRVGIAEISSEANLINAVITTEIDVENKPSKNLSSSNKVTAPVSALHSHSTSRQLGSQLLSQNSGNTRDSSSSRVLRSTLSAKRGGEPTQETAHTLRTEQHISHPISKPVKSEPPLEERQSQQQQQQQQQHHKRRFFEEKETDLFKAALHESKIMAEKQYIPSPAPTSRLPAKKDSKKTTSSRNNHVGGSIKKVVATSVTGKDNSASKKFNGVDVTGNVRKEKRTLKRVQSAVTDYGDDDFEGLSEADFEWLC